MFKNLHQATAVKSKPPQRCEMITARSSDTDFSRCEKVLFRRSSPEILHENGSDHDQQKETRDVDKKIQL